ncbi:MAG TPA: hypothetical protein VGC09_07525 [Rhodopila sp.]
MRNLALAGACLFGLSACDGTAITPTTVTTSLTTAQQDLQKALNLYGIAKGIAQIAEMADPALVPVLAPAIAAMDPLVARAQVALNDASADATALEALVAQISQQANALTVQSAAVIKVVPAAT